ncbi:MAG: helix-turn-helix domain-containing protein [Candidatus Omnitrophica bacterium]|nr:helix-turn-helix domain-containing protein [Candidatus Omnitrophota bacterium]MCM8807216.1 helix-turn-helix domain-containing protein [Candidatus Omnitrophota bacterium]
MDWKDLSKLIKEERRKRNLTLEKINEEIKIPVKFLKSIEEGEWEKLPSKIHMKAILTKYLKYLELDLNIEELFKENKKEEIIEGKKVDRRIFLILILFFVFLILFLFNNYLLNRLLK